MTIKRIFIFKQGMIGDRAIMFLNLNEDHKIIETLRNDILSLEEKLFVTILELAESEKMFNVSQSDFDCCLVEGKVGN